MKNHPGLRQAPAGTSGFSPSAEDLRTLTDLEAVCRTAAAHYRTAVQLSSEPVLRGLLREQGDRYRQLATVAADLGRHFGAEPLSTGSGRETLARLSLRLRFNFSADPEETLQSRCEKAEEEAAACLAAVLGGELPQARRIDLERMRDELGEVRGKLKRLYHQPH